MAKPTKRKPTTVGGKIADSAKKVFGRKKDEVSPGKLAEENRARADKLRSTLQGIIFTGAFPNLPEDASGDALSKAQMEKSVNALIHKIQESPTIVYDLEPLDSVMQQIADILNTAVKSNYPNQASWCIRALSHGILYLRDNIPPEVEEQSEELMKLRVAHIKKYLSIVKLYGELDAGAKIIADTEATMNKRREEYEPLREEILDLDSTDEGKLLIARISAHQNDPSSLSDEERDLVAKANEIGHMASNIALLRDKLYAQSVEREGKISEAMGFRNALADAPVLYDPKLTAEYGVLLDELVNGIQLMLDNAKAIIDYEKAAEAKLKTVMDSKSAQLIAAYGAGVIDNLTIPKHRDDTRTKLEMQIRERKQKEALRRELQLKQLAHWQAENVQEVLDFNTQENEDINEEVLTETVEDVQEADDQLYNYNS